MASFPSSTRNFVQFKMSSKWSRNTLANLELTRLIFLTSKTRPRLEKYAVACTFIIHRFTVDILVVSPAYAVWLPWPAYRYHNVIFSREQWSLFYEMTPTLWTTGLIVLNRNNYSLRTVNLSSESRSTTKHNKF